MTNECNHPVATKRSFADWDWCGTCGALRCIYAGNGKVYEEGEGWCVPTALSRASALDVAFFEALSLCNTKEPLALYNSNSWNRIGLASRYQPVVIPERLTPDWHLSISNAGVLRAMVAAFNAMLARRP